MESVRCRNRYTANDATRPVTLSPRSRLSYLSVASATRAAEARAASTAVEILPQLGDPPVREFAVELTRHDGHYCSANATYVPPLGAPFFPPPHAITMYCRPLTMYVDGVALPAAGNTVSHSSRPVALS